MTEVEKFGRTVHTMLMFCDTFNICQRLCSVAPARHSEAAKVFHLEAAESNATMFPLLPPSRFGVRNGCGPFMGDRWPQKGEPNVHRSCTLAVRATDPEVGHAVTHGRTKSGQRNRVHHHLAARTLHHSEGSTANTVRDLCGRCLGEPNSAPVCSTRSSMQVADLVRVLHGDVVGKISDWTPPLRAPFNSPNQAWNSQSSTSVLSGSLSCPENGV